jgi:hypothetical protein
LVSDLFDAQWPDAALSDLYTALIERSDLVVQGVIGADRVRADGGVLTVLASGGCVDVVDTAAQQYSFGIHFPFSDRLHPLCGTLE